MKVAVAMSGGVDSSFAALRLKREGHIVHGVSMRLMPCAAFASMASSRRPLCCRPEDLRDARETARAIGIPHSVIDLSKEFSEQVVEECVSAYLAGLTPNPCVICNEKIKFGVFLEEMLRSGFDRIATGHYARLREGASGVRLLRGTDTERDQAYFLYRVGPEALERSLFPAGSFTKRRVREMVAEAGLPVAEKSESRDVCFVRKGGMRDFLRERRPECFRPGPVVDLDGNVLGEHDGAAGYTIGQRKGLRIAGGEPLYVVRVDVTANTVVLGPEEALHVSEIRITDAVSPSGLPPDTSKTYLLKVRFRAEPVPATLRPDASGWLIETLEPVRAPAPGQSAVLFDGDEVVFGGTISPLTIHP